MVETIEDSKFGNINYDSGQEKMVKKQFVEQFKQCPIPDDEILSNLGLFLNSKNLSRILFLDHIYQQIIGIHGSVVEFGTRWGQNSAVFTALRGIYEPFNRHRKIIGFDTFEGFPAIAEQDGNSVLMRVGNDSVTENYVDYLSKLLELQEASNPLAHIKKFDIIKGNGIIEFERYLEKHPETIIALAYFDFDIYEPTKKCLEAIRGHFVKGSVLAFDELNDPDSPGETTALKEVFGLQNVRLQRYRYASRTSYFIVE